MTLLDTKSASLYRSFLRGLRKVTGQDASRLINLKRSFRAQWDDELAQATARDRNSRQAALDAVEQKMLSTLSLLTSSRRFTANLSSLSYHHHPYHLRSTSNSSRLYSHLPKPIEWDPQDPQKAMKLYDKRERDRREKGDGRLARLADLGLRSLRDRAERDLDVMLGRWETRS